LCRQVRASPNERSTQRRRLDAKWSFSSGENFAKRFRIFLSRCTSVSSKQTEVLSARWQPICKQKSAEQLRTKYMKRRIANEEMFRAAPTRLCGGAVITVFGICGPDNEPGERAAEPKLSSHTLRSARRTSTQPVCSET